MDIQPIPAVALGAYEVTPLEIAGGYTIFANHGIYSKPYFSDQHLRTTVVPIFSRQGSTGRYWIHEWLF